MSLDLGIVIRPELDPEGLAGHARAAEAAGFAELWLWEDCFLAGGIAAAATALAATERIAVGLGIMPAPVRNAAFAAMEIAALARLHPGRFHAGLGHGVGEWMHQVGAKPASQLAQLEEMVAAVRALLAGETVTTEGRYVRLRGVALGHPPAAAPPRLGRRARPEVARAGGPRGRRDRARLAVLAGLRALGARADRRRPRGRRAHGSAPRDRLRLLRDRRRRRGRDPAGVGGAPRDSRAGRPRSWTRRSRSSR